METAGLPRPVIKKKKKRLQQFCGESVSSPRDGGCSVPIAKSSLSRPDGEV